ncbi:MAG: CmcI family methyltransferase [Syntrophales bacterium]
MLTRKEFEEQRIQSAMKMAEDSNLQKEALDVLVRADHYNWVHQTNWLGEPILQLPQDMFALQEIIFSTKPEFIIEAGVAWGGSLLFYSTLMEVLGGRRIIGIDIYIPNDLKERIGSFGKISDRITWINDSSIDEHTIDKVKSIVGDSRKVMVILDSNHTHDHVMTELRLYSEFIGKGYYIVCSDTIIEFIPEQKHRPRPWYPGNNTQTAVLEFLKKNDRFVIDESIDRKLLLTCMPRGFLKCIKDP